MLERVGRVVGNIISLWAVWSRRHFVGDMISLPSRVPHKYISTQSLKLKGLVEVKCLIYFVLGDST